MRRCDGNLRGLCSRVLFGVFVPLAGLLALPAPSLPAQQFSAAAPKAAAASGQIDVVAQEATLHRGILLFSAGDFRAAAAELESISNENAIAAQYLALAREELDGTAAPNTFEPAPDSLESSLAAASTDWLAESPADRRWNFTVINGYQSDSNVVLSPEFVGLGAPTNMADSSWFIASFGDYRLVQDVDRNIGLIMSTYNNFYFQQNDFDLQDYMGGLYYNALWSERWMAGIRYEFHETLLDYRHFSYEHRLVPNLTYLRGDCGHTTLYYEFNAAEFDFLPLVPDQDRDGVVQGVGVTHAIYTNCGLGRIFLGYRFESADAEGGDFDRATNMVTARLERPIGDRAVFDLEVRQFWDDYRHPNSLDFFGRPRSDQRTELRTGLQWYWGPHASLRLDYTYIDSNSNVANLFGVNFFEYDRHLLTPQFLYDF